ncbi:MAG: DUF3455 domain-containing protein [Caulobacteraceae bacterium]
MFADDGATALMTVHAQGVQIYECVDAGGGKAAWKFREPLATLILDGKTVGRHFAGPTWELTDGSGVVGKVIVQSPGKTERDVAWLRLEAIAHLGGGILTQVAGVVRLNTRGGAFAGACGQLGDLHLEPYAADYVFLKG